MYGVNLILTLLLDWMIRRLRAFGEDLVVELPVEELVTMDLKFSIPHAIEEVENGLNI